MAELSDDDLQRLRRQLDERESALHSEVQFVESEEDASTGGDTYPSTTPRDRGEEGEERLRSGVRHVERQRDRQELREIEDARERMAKGEYGACIDCGIDIPLARLEAQPTAQRCLPCQEAYERSHPVELRLPTP